MDAFHLSFLSVYNNVKPQWKKWKEVPEQMVRRDLYLICLPLNLMKNAGAAVGRSNRRFISQECDTRAPHPHSIALKIFHHNCLNYGFLFQAAAKGFQRTEAIK